MKRLNRPTKQEAVKQLQELARDIIALKSKGRTNQTFKKWLHDAELTIGHIFFDLPHHIEAFKSIDFEPLFLLPFPMDVFDAKGEAFLNGLNRLQVFLEKRIYEIKTYWQDNDTKYKSAGRRSRNVFIIHGHDEEMKHAVIAVLKKLAFKPIVLHEQPNLGRTIIEKFEDHSGDVSFAIVILSPDDMAYARKQASNEARPRVRQNVVLELGFFIGRLGRNNVFLLFREETNFELPSDYKGVVYTPYDKEDVWKTKMANELKSCGYKVDANKLL